MGPAFDVSKRLDGWKEISAHLGRSVRTVQRWEAVYGLPIHRLSEDRKSPVFAFVAELDAWLLARKRSGWTEADEMGEQPGGPPAADSPVPAGGPGHATEDEVDAPLPVQPPPVTQAAIPAADPRLRKRWWLAAMAAGLLVLAVSWGWWEASASRVQPRDASDNWAVRALTVRSLATKSPSPSPDGQQIAFMTQAAVGDVDALHVWNRSGASLRRLTHSPRREFFPAWSPDGEWIAFVRGPMGGPRGTLTEIRRVRPDGSGEELVATLSAFTWASSISWAPDGSHLLVVERASAEEPFRIAALDLKSKALRFVTQPPPGSYGDFFPVYFPSGTRIAFQRYRGVDENETDLLLQELAARSAPRVINTKPAKLNGIAVDNTGRWIAAGLFDGSRSALMLFPWQQRRPGIAIPLPQHLHVGHPAFAATEDSAEVVVPLAMPSPQRVHVLEAKEGYAWRDPPCMSLSGDFHPEFLLDGTQLLMTMSAAGDRLGICDSGTGEVKMLPLATAGKLSQARLSPDGKTLAYLAVHENRVSLWTAPLETPEQAAKLADLGEAGGQYAWRRDGQAIFVTRIHGGERTLWEWPLDGGSPRRRGPRDLVYPTVDLETGRLYVSRLHSGTLYILNDDDSLTAALAVGHPGNYLVNKGWVYVMQATGAEQPPAVYRHRVRPDGTAEGAGELLASSPRGHWQYSPNALAVSRDGERIAFAVHPPERADLYTAVAPDGWNWR